MPRNYTKVSSYTRTTVCASGLKRALFALLCGAFLLLSCQESDSDPRSPAPFDTLWTFEKFLAEAETTDVNLRSALVDSFLNYWGPLGIPPTNLHSDSAFGTAAFLYQSTANAATVAGDFNGWNPNADNLQRLNGTTLMYRSFRFERNARFDYKFVYNNGNSWVLDPLNPRTFPGGFGPNSQMWMPDFVPPVEAQNDTSIAHGREESFSITSNILGNSRTVRVYLPAGYDTSGSYPVLYCHDGNDYRTYLKIETIANNLIAAGRVPAFIVVLVPPVNREGEYHMNPLFARFFTEELIPRIDSVYATDARREGRAIVGESSGGLGALYMAWHQSNYFRLCIPQSGYFSFNGDAIIDSIQANAARDLKIYMNVGTYEGNVGGDENLYAAQQRLEQVLIAKGYEHRAVYLPDGHSWANWQRVMPEALEWVFEE